MGQATVAWAQCAGDTVMAPASADEFAEPEEGGPADEEGAADAPSDFPLSVDADSGSPQLVPDGPLTHEEPTANEPPDPGSAQDSDLASIAETGEPTANEPQAVDTAQDSDLASTAETGEPDNPDDSGSSDDTAEPADPTEPTGPDDDTPTTPQNGWWTDPDNPSHTYFFKNGERQRGWVRTKLSVADNAKGPLRRYWLDVSYRLVRGRVINPTKSQDKISGVYLAYARPDGTVATGIFKANGRIYLANSKGKLAQLKGGAKRGWLVTSAYTFSGKSQRYYLYLSTKGKDKGAYYAKPGFSRNGYPHYTLSKGHVLWYIKHVGNKVYVTNSAGRMAAPKKSSSESGWLQTTALDGKLRRYYLYRETKGTYKGGYYAKTGFSTDGYAHYTTGKGFVKCSLWKSDGRLYLANAKGKILQLSGDAKSGWVDSDGVDGTKHRYYLYRSTRGKDKGICYAKTGLSSDGYLHYTTSRGYVVTNKDQKIDGVWYHADRQGKLTKYTLPEGLRWASNYTSPTNWLILVDNTSNYVHVLTGSKGRWTVNRKFSCSTGKASTPTVRGTFRVGSRGYSFGEGYTCYYWTQFYNDYLFHSVLYDQGTFVVQDGTLGANVSHGCVRLQIDNARWIYETIPSGTTVVSY